MQSSELFNYYLAVNMNNICRICLEKGIVPYKMTPIFDPIKPPHFSNLIMAVASVQVAKDDGLPSLICNKCIVRLNTAYQFKMQCESSDAKLRQYFESLQQLPQTTDLPEFTIEIKKDPIVNDNSQHQQQQQNDQTQLQVLQPLNPIMEASTSTNQMPATISIEVKDEIDYAKCIVVGELHFNEAIKDMQKDNFTSPEKVKKKSLKQHQCDTCGKVFRNKPGLIHHIRIHTGERPYVCHLCDKRFINGGHLHTHMRTHTGEKNHICSACSKAFATAQQLTKHTIAIHTSERPYGCTYCPKRFASSSNLNTHTKIHTGEKNYHCDQCGKAFSTKGQLYQHMLVHTGEKAFLCEYCNKRFSQKAHLIRHLKMHK